MIMSSGKRCRQCGDFLGCVSVIGGFCSDKCLDRYLYGSAQYRVDDYCILCGEPPDSIDHKLGDCIYVAPSKKPTKKLGPVV